MVKKQVKQSLASLKKQIIPILKRHKVKKAGIFGSYARGEQNKKSDVDVLILPPKGMGLEFVALALELEEKLHKKVDLLSYRAIHPLLKDYILKDEVRII